MIIAPIKPPLIRSLLRNCNTKFNLLSSSPSSSLSATSATISNDKTAVCPPVHENSHLGKDKGKTTGKDDRPFIFLWTRDQPSNKGQGTVVRLPECDVVYKEEPKDKVVKRIRQKTLHHCLSDGPTEGRLLKYYLSGKADLSDNPSIFCVFNSGESKLPEKLLRAKAQRVVILEPPKSESLREWQDFGASNAELSKGVIVKPYDFNRLQAGRVRDFHNNKGVDSLCQLFRKAGAVSVAEDAKKWCGENNSLIENPPIRIMGVAKPYNEHSLFATLLYSRIIRSSVYEFGPTELLVAVTPQQYLDFHPVLGQEHFSNDREKVPKLVGWRARLYQYLFEIDVVTKSPFDAFTPEIPTKKLKFMVNRESSNPSLYERHGIETDKMYWVSIKPKRNDLETLTSENYGEANDGTDRQPELERRRQFPHLAGFVFMYKTLSHYKKAAVFKEFLKNYLSGIEPQDFKIGDPRLTMDDEISLAGMKDLVDLYKTLAERGGEKFYNSPLYSSAQKFVESIECPDGAEPKFVGRSGVTR